MLDKYLTPSNKLAFRYSAVWAAVCSAMSLIMNAIPSIIIVLLIILVPLSLFVPVVIGFVVAKKAIEKGKNKVASFGKLGATCGIIYALIMVIVALFFILLNYGISALFWAEFGIMIEGIMVAIVTLIVGLPVLGIISVIGGAIGAIVTQRAK
jgi:hypothetical protein